MLALVCAFWFHYAPDTERQFEARWLFAMPGQVSGWDYPLEAYDVGPRVL